MCLMYYGNYLSIIHFMFWVEPLKSYYLCTNIFWEAFSECEYEEWSMSVTVLSVSVSWRSEYENGIFCAWCECESVRVRVRRWSESDSVVLGDSSKIDGQTNSIVLME